MIELLTHLSNIESSMKQFRKELIERKNRFQKMCDNFVDTEDYYEKNIEKGIILTEELIEIYILIVENFQVLTDPFNMIITLDDLKHMMNITNKHTKRYIKLILPLEKHEPLVNAVKNSEPLVNHEPLVNNEPLVNSEPLVNNVLNNEYELLLQEGLTILLELKEKLDGMYTTYLNKVEPNNLQNYYFNDITENKYYNMIYVEEKILD